MCFPSKPREAHYWRGSGFHGGREINRDINQEIYHRAFFLGTYSDETVKVRLIRDRGATGYDAEVSYRHGAGNDNPDRGWSQWKPIRKV